MCQHVRHQIHGHRLIASFHHSPDGFAPSGEIFTYNMANVRIKMTTSVVGSDFAYPAGEELETTAARAADLVQAGHAIRLDTAKAPHQTAEKPASPAAKAEKRG